LVSLPKDKELIDLITSVIKDVTQEGETKEG